MLSASTYPDSPGNLQRCRLCTRVVRGETIIVEIVTYSVRHDSMGRRTVAIDHTSVHCAMYLRENNYVVAHCNEDEVFGDRSVLALCVSLSAA